MSQESSTHARSALHTLRLCVFKAGSRFTAPIWTALARCQLRIWGCKAGKDLSVHGRLRLNVFGHLRIGSRVRMNSGRDNFVGIEQRMALYVGAQGELEIGDGCGLSNSTICCYDSIIIQPQAFIGGGCSIYDTDFHQLDAEARITNRGPINTAPVLIGSKAWIGGHSIILKGVIIGEGAVIGAGSIVTKSVPPYEIWAGSPARFIRKLTALQPGTDMEEQCAS